MGSQLTFTQFVFARYSKKILIMCYELFFTETVFLSTQGGKVNNIWNEIENLCREKDYIAYTYSNQVLNDLNADTMYRVELKAHNAIGYSAPTNVYVKTARGESPSSFGTLTYQAGFNTSSATKAFLHFMCCIILCSCSFLF